MPRQLILVRHGQTRHNALGLTSGWTDSDLSEIGQEQAERVAQHIALHYSVDAIYSSPLRRAADTARAIGRQTGLTPISRDDLREIGFGLFEGLTKAEIVSRYPEAAAALERRDDPDLSYPDGESLRGFYERVSWAFREILIEASGQAIAVVAHGGVLGSYVADLTVRQPLLWTKYVPHNCAVTEVAFDQDGPRVARFDDCSFQRVVTPARADARQEPLASLRQ